MAGIGSKKLSEIYGHLLHIGNNVDASVRAIQDGDGNESAIKISNKALYLRPTADSTGTLEVTDDDGNTIIVKKEELKLMGDAVNTIDGDEELLCG